MSCEKLTLETLGLLSGGLFGFSLQRHINQITDDLDDRGTDGYVSVFHIKGIGF